MVQFFLEANYEHFIFPNFWTMLFTWCNLLILYLVLKKILFKPIKNMIDSRQKEVDDMYSNAENAEAEANGMRREYEEKLSGAKAESEEILRDAQRRAILREEEIIKAAEAEAGRIMERAEAEIGDIEILINNAAVSSISLISDVSLEEWNRVMNTCVTGAFLYTKCVLSKMINKKRGRIINISSMWGNVGASCEVHYSTAKAALNGFTKALAKELGPSGITVNAIAPGLIKTDMNAALDEQTLAGICDDTPMGRIGLPDDVAEAALFLASEKASFITGEIMNVSGGYVV